MTRRSATPAPEAAAPCVSVAPDPLAPLNGALPLRAKLIHVHRAVQARLPFVARIAIAISDPRTGILSTFVHSSGEDDPLSRYQAELSEAPSLAAMLASRRPRVINDLSVFAKGQHEHTRRIWTQGYRASYTLPMFSHDVFFGFVFFNSYQEGVFTDRALRELEVYAHLLALLVVHELDGLRNLAATVASAAHLASARDPETGGHLDRMSHYARLIAERLAADRGLAAELVERVFVFAPLHDIGKIGIPDEILLKPGPLSEAERALMRTHAERGLDLVDALLSRAGLETLEGVEVLRNIVLHHHEWLDGSGYPRGLRGEAIPLEARIVAVADVFDALTSRRPYKEARSIDEAAALLGALVGTQFDGDCVRALLADRTALELIRQRYAEDAVG